MSQSSCQNQKADPRNKPHIPSVIFLIFVEAKRKYALAET